MNPNDFSENSFKRNLSIKKRNKIHISYNVIFEIIFDKVLLLILDHPVNFTLLKSPVRVSSIIAEATAIKSPCIGTNNNMKDDAM